MSLLAERESALPVMFEVLVVVDFSKTFSPRNNYARRVDCVVRRPRFRWSSLAWKAGLMGHVLVRALL